MKADMYAWPDTTALTYRPVQATDLERVRRMFRRSSPMTVYRRFFCHYSGTPPEHMLRRLTVVDYVNRHALAALCDDEVVGHDVRRPGGAVSVERSRKGFPGRNSRDIAGTCRRATVLLHPIPREAGMTVVTQLLGLSAALARQAVLVALPHGGQRTARANAYAEVQSGVSRRADRLAAAQAVLQQRYATAADLPAYAAGGR